MRLVEQSPLRGARFRRERDDDRAAERIERFTQPRDEGGVGLALLGQYIFKIHVQPEVMSGLHGLENALHQSVLRVRVLQDERGAGVVEAALLRERGEMHERGRAVLPRGGEQPFVRERQQCAVGLDAVGEGREVGEIGQRGVEQRTADKGIAVSVDGKRASGLVVVGDDERLPGVEGAAPAESGVILIERPRAQAIAQGDGIDALAARDRVQLARMADHERLPDGERSVRRDAVDAGEDARRHTVSCGDR